MSDRFNKQLANIDFSLMKTLEIAKKYGAEEYQDKNLYTDIADKICIIRENTKIVSDIVQSNGELSTVDELETIIANAKNKKTNFKKSVKYQELTKQINEILTPTAQQSSSGDICLDDDDMSVQAEISPIDPITKRIIEHPVKNKKCNHRYEKTSILESIKRNQRFRCPVVGCANSNFITENDLEEDFYFLQQIQRTQN